MKMRIGWFAEKLRACGSGNIFPWKIRGPLFAAALALCLLAAAAAQAQEPVSPRWLQERWEAEWITHPDGPHYDPALFLFRRILNLDQKPDRFVVHVSADQRYQLFVNGARVSWGPARGDLLHWRYESVDLAPHLRPGRNVLAVKVWSAGIMAPWAQHTAHTAFILQGDGEAGRAANTPQGWKVARDASWAPLPRPGTRPSSCAAGSNERVAAALHPWDWMDPDFDDAAWSAPEAVATGVPSGLNGDGTALWYLTPRPIPLMAETPARLSAVRRAKGVDVPDAFVSGAAPLEIPAHSKASILLDNRTLTNAYPVLVTSGGRDAVVRLSYEECLFKYPEIALDNRIKGDRDNIKKCAIRDNYRFDEFIPDGGAARAFQPLWWRTFRYLQMDIDTAEEPLRIDDLRLIETGYPFKAAASFKSSDPQLETIWDTGWRTARLCAGETYFDCPYYEQLQYAGDTRIQALLSYYVTGDDRLARNAIELLHDSRIPDGLTMSRYPSRFHQVIAPFALAWIGMVRDHWEFYRDPDFTKKFQNTADGILDWFAAHREANGLPGSLPWWNFVDWSWPGGVPPGAHGGGSCIIGLQFVLALRETADMAAALGRTESAIRHLALAGDTADAVSRACWDPGRGLMADSPAKDTFSQHATTLAVLADVIPADKQEQAMRSVMSDATLTQGTFYFRYFIHKAAVKAGLGDAYLTWLEPWRHMLDLGLSTWPETMDVSTRSDCHAWSAGPTFELLSVVCGVEPDGPGFASVRVAPHPGTLEWAACEVPHPAGTIRVAFKHKNGRLSTDVVLPPGVSGTFVYQGKSSALNPGKQTVERDLPKGN